MSWSSQRANIGQDKGYASGFAINNLGYIVGGQDCLATKTRALWQYTPLPIGISSIDESTGISFFPNPATSELTVQSSQFVEIENIEMYSSLGKKVFEKHPSSDIGHLSISVADFPPGIYFITVTDQAGNKVTKKVVKM